MSSSSAAVSEPQARPRRLQVLFVIDNLEIGGVQEFLINYARQIPSHAVTVACLAGPGPMQAPLEEAGAAVRLLGAGPVGAGRLAQFLRSFLGLRRLLAEEGGRFDAIHVHLWRAFAYACALRLYRLPKVTAALACTRAQMPGSVQWFYSCFARYYAHFFVHAPARREFGFLGVPEERLLDQPYFVTERDLSVRERPEADLVLLTIGRLIPQKGHDRAISFQRAVQAADPRRTVLCVLGDGPDRPRLAALADPAGDGVRLVPATLQFARHLAGADAIVKFAVGEGPNSVVRECLCAGLFVASTLETRECHELAEAGLLFPLDAADLDGSARRLLAALREFGPERAAEIRRAARTRWNNEQIRALYESLILPATPAHP